MRASKFQNVSSHPAQARGDHPLAQSALSGQNRLRELEHLAATARKVRDQAAADLSRNGNAHHIARDRLAAAERMLQKTQKEMKELRAQLGMDQAKPAPKAAPQSAEDFELAMLLGHSNKRLKHDSTGPDSFTIEADDDPHSSRYQGSNSRERDSVASRLQTQSHYQSESRYHTQTRQQTQTRSPNRTKAKTQSVSSRARRGAGSASFLRMFGIGLFVLLGIGLGAAGTYIMVTSDSVPDAAQNVSDGASKVATTIKKILPQDSGDDAVVTSPAANTDVIVTPPTAAPVTVTPPQTPAKPKATKLDPFQKRALEEHEERLRKAAEERLARKIAEQEAAAAAALQSEPTQDYPAINGVVVAPAQPVQVETQVPPANHPEPFE